MGIAGFTCSRDAIVRGARALRFARILRGRPGPPQRLRARYDRPPSRGRATSTGRGNWPRARGPEPARDRRGRRSAGGGHGDPRVDSRRALVARRAPRGDLVAGRVGAGRNRLRARMAGRRADRVRVVDRICVLGRGRPSGDRATPPGRDVARSMRRDRPRGDRRCRGGVCASTRGRSGPAGCACGDPRDQTALRGALTRDRRRAGDRVARRRCVDGRCGGVSCPMSCIGPACLA